MIRRIIEVEPTTILDIEIQLMNDDILRVSIAKARTATKSNRRSSVSVSVEQVKRVCRMYATNKQAIRALEISQPTFKRLCKEHDIETPYQRVKRHRTRLQTPSHEAKND